MGTQTIAGDAERPDPRASTVTSLQGGTSLTRTTPIHGIHKDLCSNKCKILLKNINSQPSSILKRQKRVRFMDVPEEHIYHITNREEAVMNKNRENPYPGLKKDTLLRLFRQERKR